MTVSHVRIVVDKGILRLGRQGDLAQNDSLPRGRPCHLLPWVLSFHPYPAGLAGVAGCPTIHAQTAHRFHPFTSAGSRCIGLPALAAAAGAAGIGAATAGV